MIQSRLESLLEASLNIASGFVISFGMWQWLVSPFLGLEARVGDSLLVTGLFTLTSLARSYLWRRCFNAGLYHMFRRLFSCSERI